MLSLKLPDRQYMIQELRKILLILTTGVALVACSSTKPDDALFDKSAKELYETAHAAVKNQEWTVARSNLTAIQNYYPYTAYAQQALIDQAYVNWKDDESKKALEDIDRFLTLYPYNKNADYMLYLRGLITFTPASAFLTSWTGQEPSERDPQGLRESYQAFQRLVTVYPDSKYTPDAKQRIVWLIATLAEHDAGVAQYYYERQAYVAAINRAQDVLRHYSGVKASEKALYILYASYDKLGLTQLAEESKAVLEKNYPNSTFLKYGLAKQYKFWDYFSPAYWLNN